MPGKLKKKQQPDEKKNKKKGNSIQQTPNFNIKNSERKK